MTPHFLLTQTHVRVSIVSAPGQTPVRKRRKGSGQTMSATIRSLTINFNRKKALSTNAARQIVSRSKAWRKAMLAVIGAVALAAMLVTALGGVSWNGGHVVIGAGNQETWENEYHRVTVGSGDTLWSLARRYGPADRDIRE